MTVTRLLLTAAAFCCAAPSIATQPVVIRPNTDAERRFLVSERSALREIGYDPECPFTRIADGPDMQYTYRFAPGRGHAAYLLVAVGTQFRIDASVDGGMTYAPVCDFLSHELVGTRVLVDLTPHLRSADAVLLRFRDRNPEDGWGALLSEILYYDAGKGTETRRTIGGRWTAQGAAYRPGGSVVGNRTTRFQIPIAFPACARPGDRAVYLGRVTGDVAGVTIGGRAMPVSRTWDGAWWADASSARGNGPSGMVVTVRPNGGRCAIAGPVRTGLRLPTCAVTPSAGTSVYRCRSPYTPEKMNALGGNFMQCLLDERYNLLAFQPGERMPIHFVHDTLRSLASLADEERACGVARVELVRHLYRGCKRAILPGGENLIAFKHDSRPIDIRPLTGTPSLTLAHKLDEVRLVASVAPQIPADGAWSTPAEFRDTPVTRQGYGGRFTRTWKAGRRELAVAATFPQGDAGRPPAFDVKLDGRGPIRVAVGSLEKPGMWFTPGSWGPEAVVLPDGSVPWSAAASGPSGSDFVLERPAFRYLLIRGGNTGEYTFCRALLVMWNGSPSRIVGRTVPGGRSGRLCTEIAVEYANDRPGSARVIVVPFDGYPEGLRTPRAIADRIVATGGYGTGIYEPVVATLASGPGADGFAAAAYVLRKYRAPEAREAERTALAVMRSAIALDRAGAHTNQLYHLIHACEYMRLLGHPEFDAWARTWADRLVAMQAPDGSWPWLNYQIRCMIALTRASAMFGEPRYRAALDRALATLDYRGGALYWKGKAEGYDDFAGAGTMGVFGAIGRRDLAAKALDARRAYVDDRGFSACSDLNPYMLGFSARGLHLRTSPPMVLGLTDFAWYDDRSRARLPQPTACVVNPHHPIAGRIRFALPGAR